MIVKPTREPQTLTVHLQCGDSLYLRFNIDSHAINNSIIEYLRQHFGLLIGAFTADTIRQEMGSAIPVSELQSMEVRGRSIREDVPKTIVLTNRDVSIAVAADVAELITSIIERVKSLPMEAEAQFKRCQIVFAGGEMLNGLANYVSEATGVRVIENKVPRLSKRRT